MLNRLLIISIISSLYAMSGNASAQQQQISPQVGETIIAKQVSKDHTKPMLLQSDDLIYDNRNNRVVARGHVEIHYNDNVLVADEVIYDKASNSLTAVGNVRIKEADGSLINAERITLKDDFRDGFLGSLRMVTDDDGHIYCQNAYRKDGTKTSCENGVFTPYPTKPEHPDRPPLWQVKSTRIVDDKVEQKLYFENAQFQFFGVTVGWLPYFYIPDPSVKQQSGFLTPSITHSGQLGYTASTPYYMAFSRSSDLLLTPEYTSKAGYLMQGDYRQRLADGSFKINLAGVYNDNASDLPGDRTYRGSIQTKGDFQINKNWSWGWDATLESDDTFRRLYGLDSAYATQIVSNIHLTGIGERNYFNATVYHFGSLANISNDPTVQTQNIAGSAYPVIDYNYVHNHPVVGGEFRFDVNIANLTVGDKQMLGVPNAFSNTYGSDNSHIVTQAQWRRTFTDQFGQQFTPIAQARADVYHVSAFQNADGSNGPEDTFTRQMLAGGVDYRYPFVAHDENASHVIEPVAQIISRTNVANNDKVNNQDAQSLVFDDTLLFDLNKFSGYDRIETGTRANYGMQYTIQTYNGVSVRFIGGESYQVAGKNSFVPGSGLWTPASDYVFGGYLDWRNMFRLTSQIRLSEKDFSAQRQDYSFTTKLGALRATVSYVSTVADPYAGFPDPRSEIAGFAAYRFNDNWTVYGDLRYSLSDDKFIRDSVGVQYSDEGAIISVSYVQSYINYLDIKPSTSVMFRYGLKFMGQVTGSGSDAIGDLSPEASVFK